jgi:hypothetical protein
MGTATLGVFAHVDSVERGGELEGEVLMTRVFEVLGRFGLAKLASRQRTANWLFGAWFDGDCHARGVRLRGPGGARRGVGRQDSDAWRMRSARTIGTSQADFSDLGSLATVRSSAFAGAVLFEPRRELDCETCMIGVFEGRGCCRLLQLAFRNLFGRGPSRYGRSPARTWLSTAVSWATTFGCLE